MKRCPQCGREYPDEANFCPNDSTPLESERRVEGDPLVGSVFHRRYEVEERLGAGGFGTVYRVRDTMAGRTVALKVVHPHILQYQKQIDRFKQEARLMANLRADQIPTLYDFNRDEQRKLWYFTLDYIPGTTLQRILEEEGALTASRALAMMRQVCAALRVAHGHEPPVIHRDLKPDNLMVVREKGRELVKILDFGIAKIRGHESLTDAGQFPGSYGYMAPEQLDGEVDPRTDLFAAGVILYNMLTARDPWLGRPVGSALQRGSQMKILRLTSDAEFIPPEEADPEIHPELAGVITRLLEKDLAARIPSAGHLDEALSRLQESVAEEAALGSLRVVSRPAGATASLLLDGEVVARGRTPWTAERLSPASYEIRVEAPRHEPAVSTVRIRAREEATTELALTRRPGVGERLASRARDGASAAGDAVARPMQAAGQGVAGGARRVTEATSAGLKAVGAAVARSAAGLRDGLLGAGRAVGRAAASLGGGIGSGASAAGRAVGGGVAAVGARVRRGVAAIPAALAAVPRPSGRAIATVAGAVLLAGGLYLAAPVVIPALMGGDAGPEPITAEELRRHLRAGDVRELRVGADGSLEASVATAGGGAVARALSAGERGLQDLFRAVRRGDAAVIGDGAARLSVRAEASGGSGSPALDSLCLRPLDRTDAGCSPLTPGGTRDLPAGWYTVRNRAAGWELSGASLRYASGTRDTLGDVLSDSATFFLPGAGPSSLRLTLAPLGMAAEETEDSSEEAAEEPETADALVARARAELRAGRLSAALGLVNEVLRRQEGHGPARELRGQIGSRYRQAAERELAREDFGAARQQALRCLEAVPEEAACRGLRVRAEEGLARAATPGSSGPPRFGAPAETGVPVSWTAGSRADRYEVRWAGGTRTVGSTSAVLPLASATDVCVAAVNASGRADEACARYEPPTEPEPAVVSMAGTWTFVDNDGTCAIPQTPIRLDGSGSSPSEQTVTLACGVAEPRRVVGFRVTSATVAADRVTLQVRRDGVACTYTAAYSDPSADTLTGTFECPSSGRSGNWRLVRQR